MGRWRICRYGQPLLQKKHRINHFSVIDSGAQLALLRAVLCGKKRAGVRWGIGCGVMWGVWCLIWGIWARPKALHYADGRECMVRIAVAAFVSGGGVLVGGMVAWFSIVVESFWCSISCCEGLYRVCAGRFSWFWWQWPVASGVPAASRNSRFRMTPA